MTRYVGLLRGVNVGGKAKVEMAALRSCFESLGYSQVRTYIQSGNVLFAGGKPPNPVTLANAITQRFGISTSVILRTSDELETALNANPFSSADEAFLHLGFMMHSPPKSVVVALDHERYLPERCAIVGKELYLYLPEGMGRAKLPGYIDRQLKVPITVRNWKTVIKLSELLET